MDEDRKDWTLSNPDDLGIWAPPEAHCLRCGSKLESGDGGCSACGYDANVDVQPHDAARRAFEQHGSMPAQQHGSFAQQVPTNGGTQPDRTWVAPLPPASPGSSGTWSRSAVLVVGVVLLLMAGTIGYLLAVRQPDAPAGEAAASSQSPGPGTSPSAATASTGPSGTTAPVPSGSQDVAALQATPQICEADGGSLGCSYPLRLDGGDLVPTTSTDRVHARVALVGPAVVADDSGRSHVLVRVRVSAFLGSVSIDPSEFVLRSSSGSAQATSVRVEGVDEQVTSRISVEAGTGFVGTLAFPEPAGDASRVDWLRGDGQPAATWTASG